MDLKANTIQVIYLLLLTVFMSCISQTKTNSSEATNKLVGVGCEGCEAIFEYGAIILISTDTLPKFQETDQS